jgi:DNA-binding MarR family transcriptional regulator
MDEALTAWPTGRLLSAAARRVEKAWDGHLDAWHLNHASFPVLVLLARSDHSQRELAAAVAVTEQTMSRMLARLERHGYVARVRHADDRRRHVVTLQPAGSRALAMATDPALVESIATAGLTLAQVAALRDALVTLLSAAAAGEGPGAGAGPIPAADTPGVTATG